MKNQIENDQIKVLVSNIESNQGLGESCSPIS